MKKWFITILLSLGLAQNANADYVNPGYIMLKQRADFVRAQNALNSGDQTTFQSLLEGLKTYPLYPYLLYAAYEKTLNDVPQETVQQFLQAYQNSPISDKLRGKWLKQLVKQQQWQAVINDYQPSSNTSMRCLYLTAKLAKGNNNEVFAELPRLWLVGSSQPESCTPLFKAWQEKGQLPDSLIIKRMQLALENKQADFAKILTKWLSPSGAASGQLLLNAYNDPPSIAQKPLFGKTFKYDPDILTFGIKRLAKKEPWLAEKTWYSFARTSSFSPEQRRKIINAIAAGYTSQNPVGAGLWIAKIDPNEIDEAIYAQQVRYALTQNNWKGAQQWIEKMPKAYRDESIWSYWYARVLEKQGYQVQAKAMYGTLTDKRNYYGLLASSHLKKDYPIKNSILPVTKTDTAFVSNQANLIRARELYAVNRYADGNLEWWRGINSLSDKQRYIAGKLAVAAGWPSLALATTSKLTHQDDLSLKFPTTYQQPVAAQAKINNLKPALLFAVIRQESLFQPSAISVAGARGLMQLMPSTAKFMANKLNVSVPYLDKLHDPNINIHLGSAYLNSLLQSYKEYPVLAIASYNAGPTRVKSWLPTHGSEPMDLWIETIPYQETREYVKYVITYTMIYEYLLGEKPNLGPYMQDIPGTSNI